MTRPTTRFTFLRAGRYHVAFVDAFMGLALVVSRDTQARAMQDISRLVQACDVGHIPDAWYGDDGRYLCRLCGFKAIAHGHAATDARPIAGYECADCGGGM